MSKRKKVFLLNVLLFAPSLTPLWAGWGEIKTEVFKEPVHTCVLKGDHLLVSIKPLQEKEASLGHAFVSWFPKTISKQQLSTSLQNGVLEISVSGLNRMAQGISLDIAVPQNTSVIGKIQRGRFSLYDLSRNINLKMNAGEVRLHFNQYMEGVTQHIDLRGESVTAHCTFPKEANVSHYNHFDRHDNPEYLYSSALTVDNFYQPRIGLVHFSIRLFAKQGEISLHPPFLPPTPMKQLTSQLSTNTQKFWSDGTSMLKSFYEGFTNVGSNDLPS